MSAEPTKTSTGLDACRELVERHVRQMTATDAGATAKGSAPVADSILLAEVIVAIEDETGVEVPMDDTTAHALRSVDSFAALIQGLLSAKESGHGG